MTVASTIAPVRVPPATTFPPFAFASAISSSIRSAAETLTSEPNTTCPRGSPAVSAFARFASFSTKASATEVVHDQAFRGHADLPLVHEGAEHCSINRSVEVGVRQHDERRLAAQLE